MAKVTNAAIAALVALFETGDKPTGPNYETLIETIREAAQDHEHNAAGGTGTGGGDASVIDNLKYGPDASKTATPAVGMVYIGTDTTKQYTCFTVNVWTQIYP